MKNIVSLSTTQLEEENPLVRAAYAVGVALLLLGTALPHSERWTMAGVALIAFSCLY